MSNPFRKFFESKIKLIKGTRFISFLFIGCSIAIAAGILWAANLYYNIDTGEVVMEEIQRVTHVLRATAGLIVGGADNQNPAQGYAFQVVGQSRLATTTFATGTVELIAADQVLRFTGGTNYYVGLKATTSLATTTVYILPPERAAAADYVLTWQPGDQLVWKSVTSTASFGDITDVGDVSSGAAFTAGGAGTTLWFHNGSYTGQLTQGTLTANQTYTLPDLTGTVALTQAGGLGTGPVLFANNGLIATSSNLYWDNTNRYLQIGSNGNAGQLRIYSSAGYYLGFAANSGMTTTTIYTWPTNAGSSGYVLTTDGSGGLSWTSVTGVGAVTGSGEQNRLARWTSTSNIATSSIVDNYTGTALTIENTGNITIANNLTVSGSGGITAALYTSSATTTLASGAGDIILDPASGKITLGTNDYIRTASGYEIGKAGTQILREMIPILGFDLPVQTASTSYVTISRTLTNYPFAAPTTGTTRVHKLIIRYVDDLPTASSSDWRVYNVTDSTTTDTFTLTGCNETDFTNAKGKTQIVETSIPGGPGDDKSWRLEVKIPTEQSGKKIRVFEVLLAAYDQIQ